MTKDLRTALEHFKSAHSFEIRFELPAVGGRQTAGNPAAGRSQERLTTLRDRAGELSDWIDWFQLGKRFEHLGLAGFWAELQKTRPAGRNSWMCS